MAANLIPPSVASALKTEIETLIQKSFTSKTTQARVVSFSDNNKTVTLSLTVDITDTLS